MHKISKQSRRRWKTQRVLTGPAESLHSQSVAEDVVAGRELACADMSVVLQPQGWHDVLSTADLPWVDQNHHLSSTVFANLGKHGNTSWQLEHLIPQLALRTS